MTKTFKIPVTTVPSNLEIMLGLKKIEHKTIAVRAVSLEEAKQKAGVQ